MHPLLQLDSNTYYEWADGNGGGIMTPGKIT